MDFEVVMNVIDLSTHHITHPMYMVIESGLILHFVTAVNSQNIV